MKLSLWKEVLRFDRIGKLSPRYIRPYKILERVGPTTYKLVLLMEMSKIHNVFHGSVLRKYIPNPTHVLEMQPIELKEDLSYEEESVQVLDEKELLISLIPSWFKW